MTNSIIRFLAIDVITLAVAGFPTANAAEKQFGLFSVDSEPPEAIRMDGALDAGQR